MEVEGGEEEGEEEEGTDGDGGGGDAHALGVGEEAAPADRRPALEGGGEDEEGGGRERHLGERE